jgi:proteic killer suppression protein
VEHRVIVIQSFRDTGTQDVFDGKNTKAARRRCPQSLWRIAARKLDQLDSVISLNELRVPPGNCLEALKGDRKGQHSIRINERYRICFVWTDIGPDAVEIVDYH